MRCPDCQKFVSMETGEPEEGESLEIDADGNITASFTVDRNCADCGTQLKTATFEVSDTLDAEVLKAHSNGDELPPGPHELSIDLCDSEVDESGGGRYAKNVFKVTLNYTVTCACDKEFTHDGSAESGGVSAGEFEECT